MSLGKLRIQLVEAKFEKDVDKIGKMDPFVHVKCREQEWKSSVAEDQGKHPKWDNEYMDIDVKYLGDDICFDCRDDDVIGSKEIGIGQFKLSAFTYNGGIDEWFQVQHKGKNAGKLHLKCTWVPVTSHPEPIHVPETIGGFAPHDAGHEAAERIRLAMEQKHAAELAHNEEERQRYLAAEAARHLQEENLRIEAARIAEEERLRIEAEVLAARIAEEERLRQEAEEETARIAEQERLAQEAAAAEEQNRLRIEAEAQAAQQEAARLAEIARHSVGPSVELGAHHQQYSNAIMKVLSVIGRPVSIRGVNDKYLTSHGSGATFSANHAQMDEQWVIFPLDNGKVCVKHLKSKMNLGFNPKGEGITANENQLTWETMTLEKGEEQNVYYLVSDFWNKVMQCNNGKCRVENQNRAAWEAVRIEPVHTEAKHCPVKIQTVTRGLEEQDFIFF